MFARLTVAGKENGTLTDVETGHQFVPRNPESFIYDADGNLTEDGRWTYVWDAENRLVSITAGAEVPDAAKKKLEFAYDSMGRRVQKATLTWNSSQYLPESTLRFVYDGWNLVAILDESDALLQSFTWGLDLSGSSQGAGGVGGLLSVRMHSGPSPGTHFYTFDGNGNVMTLVDATTATASARHEYGPFGELIRASGEAAQINPFRFSTKYQDSETGLLYYGFRYYDTSTGRWLSRDPLGESGGLNLCGFVLNRPSNYFDELGMAPYGNPVSGPGGPVGPSSPYAPNPWAPHVGPMPFNLWRGVWTFHLGNWLLLHQGYVPLNLLAPEWNDTNWYDQNRPNSVSTAKNYWSDWTPVPGQQFEYAFDDIGNRTSTEVGGNAAEGGLRSATYAANSLNQYDSRTMPGAFDVAGIANANETLTVNGSAPDYRRGEYFQELVNVDNTGGWCGQR